MPSQPDVENRDFGSQRGYPRHRLGHRACLADHIQIGIGPDEVDQATPDEFVIIDEKDCHHGDLPVKNSSSGRRGVAGASSSRVATPTRIKT